ncbi:MAG: hypothetical protein U0841_00265 [Chloroflexia bacterium]
MMRSVSSSMTASSMGSSSGDGVAGLLAKSFPPRMKTSVTPQSPAKRPVKLSSAISRSDAAGGTMAALLTRPELSGTFGRTARALSSSFTMPAASSSAGPSTALVSTEIASPSCGSQTVRVMWPG